MPDGDVTKATAGRGLSDRAGGYLPLVIVFSTRLGIIGSILLSAALTLGVYLLFLAI